MDENDKIYHRHFDQLQDWKEKNKLTTIQEAIFGRILFHMCDNNWSEWTPIDHIRLMDGLHITCEEYVKNINQLESLGLIEYKAEKFKWVTYNLNRNIFH